jgi:hypothetical protein
VRAIDTVFGPAQTQKILFDFFLPPAPSDGLIAAGIAVAIIAAVNGLGPQIKGNIRQRIDCHDGRSFARDERDYGGVCVRPFAYGGKAAVGGTRRAVL